MKNIWEQDKKQNKNGQKAPNNEKYKLMYFVPYILFVFILMVFLNEEGGELIQNIKYFKKIYIFPHFVHL